MAKGLSTYGKYSVQEDRSGYLKKNVDGSPILGEKINEVRLDEQTVSLLNKNWESFKEYFVLKEEEELKEIKPIEAKAVVIASVEIPQVASAEELKKGITLEKLKAMSDEEVDKVLSIMSKREMFELTGVAYEANKLAVIKLPEAIEKAKAQLTKLKSE